MSPPDQPDVVNALQQEIGRGSAKLFDTVPYLLRTVIEDRAWLSKSDKHGDRFESFEAFVSHPLWWGLESSIEELIAYCRNAPDVQQLIREQVSAASTRSEAGAKGGRGNKAVGNTRCFDEANTATYALRRLKRDRPDLAEKVVAGALSAHAAAVEAGFRAPTWTAPADPIRLAEAIERKFPGWKLIRTN